MNIYERMLKMIYAALDNLPSRTPFGFDNWNWDFIYAQYLSLNPTSQCPGGVFEDQIGQYVIVFWLNALGLLLTGDTVPLFPYPCK